MTIVNASPPTCDGRATGIVATDWSLRSTPCQAVTGLTTWSDSEGQSHRACRHHRDGLLRRYPARYISEVDGDGLSEVKAARDLRYEDHDELAGTHCYHAGHVPGCAGRVGGTHELLPGWVSMEIDGDAVEVELA